MNGYEVKIFKPQIDFVDRMKLTYQPCGIDIEGNLYFLTNTYDILNKNDQSADVFIEEDPVFMVINIEDIEKL